MIRWHRLAHETLRIRGGEEERWRRAGDTGDGLQYGPVAW